MEFKQGELYIIKNTDNIKAYIGKTYIGVQNRWKQHLYAAKRYHTKLYKAMKEIGTDKFYIEKIGDFKLYELEQKETEYIDRFDSFNNGYNSNCGGALGLTHFIDEAEFIGGLHLWVIIR